MLPILGEPPRSTYDLRFQVFGVPVRVSPLFWLTAVLLGIHGDALHLVAFVFAAFISILVHELGHAMVMRRFGEKPRIVLLLSGGLAIADRPSYLPDDAMQRSSREQILISLAGPGAGFVFAALIAVVVVVVGGQLEFALPLSVFADFQGSVSAEGENLAGLRFLSILATVFLQINIFWGLINLLPVYPLDGGQVARELLTRNDPWQGIQRALWVSVITGAVVCVAGLVYRPTLLLGILFGALAFSNFQTLQRMRGTYGGGYGRPW